MTTRPETMTPAGISPARGRQGGRRPVVTPGKLERARALLAQGLNVREAATRLKIGKTALYDALANAKSP
jgi:DNA invertase Pin-like site-specific DNA recombinase